MNPELSFHRRSPFLTAIALFALAFLVRVPFAKFGNLSPDAVEYIDIARNIAHGKGAVSSIKWHFFTNEPVVHSAWGERPVLLSYLMASLDLARPSRASGSNDGEPPVAATDSLILLQAFNSLLGALGAALLYLWVRSAGSGEKIALWSAALYAINPASIMCSAYVWTESLFIVLLLLTWMTLTTSEKDEESGQRTAPPSCETANSQSEIGNPQSAIGYWLSAILPALFTALAFYARPTGILLIPAIGVWMALRRQWRRLAVFVVVAAVAIIPYYVLAARGHGSPFYSLQEQHLRVGHIEHAMAAGYGRQFPSAIQFISSYPRAVCQAIASHLFQYTQDLFSFSYFSVLGFFLVAALVRFGRNSPYAPALLFAILHFFAVGVIWAAPVDSNRFLLIPFVCLLPSALEGLRSWRQSGGEIGGAGRRALATATALALVVLFYGVLNGRLYDGVRRNDRMRPATEEFIRFTTQSLPANAVLAASDAFVANFYYRRPTIVLPDPPESGRLRAFISEYKPDFILGPPNLSQSLAPLVEQKLVTHLPAPPESPFLWWRVATH